MSVSQSSGTFTSAITEPVPKKTAAVSNNSRAEHDEWSRADVYGDVRAEEQSHLLEKRGAAAARSQHAVRGPEESGQLEREEHRFEREPHDREAAVLMYLDQFQGFQRAQIGVVAQSRVIREAYVEQVLICRNGAEHKERHHVARQVRALILRVEPDRKDLTNIKDRNHRPHNLV